MSRINPMRTGCANELTKFGHAANAKARATQMVSAGKLSPASAAKIRAKADRILGKD